MQYLKFGFPLSLTYPDRSNNIDVINQYSVLQYANTIQDYHDKEKSLGAVLSPVYDIKYPGMHFSPLLTGHKDTDKRIVILNLSYPHGCSLNDNADKPQFDGKKFVLKFPCIDDIVTEICKYDIEVWLSKIDISKAVQNLRVDPADKIKFGIKWTMRPRSAGSTHRLCFSSLLMQFRTLCNIMALKLLPTLMILFWSLNRMKNSMLLILFQICLKR